MRHSKIIAVTAAVLACAVAQAGDVYKYTDERGNTMYTDRPMPGAIKVSSASVRPPEVTARSYAAQQAASNQQLSASNQRIAQAGSDARTADAVAKDLEATRVERCKKARTDYDNSINSRRMYRLDEAGNRVYLTDAEISQQRLDARKSVDAICGPQG
jgi:hypothetical protein